MIKFVVNKGVVSLLMLHSMRFFKNYHKPLDDLIKRQKYDTTDGCANGEIIIIIKYSVIIKAA